MFPCEVRIACDGTAGDFVMNFAGANESQPADMGVCLRCLRALCRRSGRGLRIAVDQYLTRVSEQ